MAYTDINGEDRLVQATFAEHLDSALGWEGVYAFNTETFGPGGTLGREDTKEVVLKRDLRAAVARLNPQLPSVVREEEVAKLTRHDFSRSLIQHNREFYRWLRDGVPVFFRFKALVMEPSIFQFSGRHDNIEAIYKKLTERRDLADVTEEMKALHRIVNAVIATTEPGEDQTEAKHYDLSMIDLEKLRDEFKKVPRKATAIEDIRKILEEKLRKMMEQNPERMDFYRKYSEIVAEYNHEKDRVTMEETFANLVEISAQNDAEARRAAEEHLSEEELAIFDLLKKGKSLPNTGRERVKAASKGLLEKLREVIGPLEQWTKKESTRAEVETEVMDSVFSLLPSPPFSEEEKKDLAENVFRHLWQQYLAGSFSGDAA